MAEASPDSPAGRVLRGLRRLVAARAANPGLASVQPALSAEGPVLIAERRAGGHALMGLSDLSGRSASARGRTLGPHEFIWEAE